MPRLAPGTRLDHHEILAPLGVGGMEHKRRLAYRRGHTVPKVDLIRESLAWLDRHLGPVG